MFPSLHKYHVIVPSSVQSIGDDAFYNCTSLSSIELPNSVQSIGDDAFRGCTSVHKLTVSKNILSKHHVVIKGLLQYIPDTKLEIVEEANTERCVICLEDADVNQHVWVVYDHNSVCVSCAIKGGYLYNDDNTVICPLCRKKQPSSDVKLVMDM